MRGLLRGSAASRLLLNLGIDARQYWLLVDMFSTLSDRRELFSQLGTNSLALKTVAGIYAVFSAIAGGIAVAAGVAAQNYLAGFLIFTAFVLFSLVLAEVNSTLLNPAEGAILAHQPVNGATYTAAKLTHLVLLIGYLVPALNLIPSLFGIVLRDAGPAYAVIHMSYAYAAGLTVALACCALFGWLMRAVPPGRLRAAGQLAEVAPWLLMLGVQASGTRAFSLPGQLLARVPPGARTAFWAVLGAASFLGIVFGIRSLSLDYLTRVTHFRHSEAKPSNPHRTFRRSAKSRFPPAFLAGFDYVRKGLLRDRDFQRQLLPLTVSVGMGVFGAAQGLRINPFSGGFSPVHFAPHLIGILTLVLCALLGYGASHKAVWVFVAAPHTAFQGFARGVHSALLLWICVLPCLCLGVALVFYWPAGDAFLFTLFSLCISAAYLDVALNLIQGIPFSRPVDPARSGSLLPVLLLTGALTAIVVVLQHFVLFRSRTTLGLLCCALVPLILVGARMAVTGLGRAMEYQLKLSSAEFGEIYREIDS